MSDRPPFAPKARARSRTATGKPWERQLEAWHAQYSAIGLADVTRVHPEAKMVDGRLRFTAKGGADFAGVIKGGRAIFFDAKVVSKGVRFSLSKVPPHQIEGMVWKQKLGALCYFMVYFVEPDVRCAIPVDACIGVSSVTPAVGELFYDEGWKLIPSVVREAYLPKGEQ